MAERQAINYGGGWRFTFENSTVRRTGKPSVVSGLAPSSYGSGYYKITYTDATGYTTPADHTFGIGQGQSVPIVGFYTQ